MKPINTLSITDIKSMIGQMPLEMAISYIEILKSDSRTACQKLGNQIEKKKLAYDAETDRMHRIFEFEREAWELGYKNVAGIDEAGRGPLVGPVVAASVILDPKVDWRGIDDSKKLSAEQRAQFYALITKHAIAYGVGIASHEEIDEINILNATKLAMKRALQAMSVDANYLLIDAVKLTDNDTKQVNLIKGDSRSASIAAASIVAKVTRDKLMEVLHEKYPVYDFAKHKGYGTDKHYDAIREYGLIAEHRRSFLKDFI